MHEAAQHDIIIAGGGLAGSLLAWRLRQLRPDLDVALVETGARLGGNHTWSFFGSDLTASQNAWIEPLVCHRWPGYEVRFPLRRRQLASGYRSITSERLHAVVAAQLERRAMTGTAIDALEPGGVRLADGRSLSAPCVIDARGDRPSRHLLLGFQKFLGIEVRLKTAHGRTLPIIMDATVPQDDGYRFVYTLPLADDRLLIEDTYYSDGAALSAEALRAEIMAYAAAQGWRIEAVVREETGVLPIILAGDVEALVAEQGEGVPRIGLGAALFHPTTGYSLPDAVRTADRLAATTPLTTATARRVVHDSMREAWRARGFFRLLNRMLFKAGDPARRYSILERFYGLDETLIQHFYAAQLTTADKARILIGKPPVPMRAALSCMSERGMLERNRGR